VFYAGCRIFVIGHNTLNRFCWITKYLPIIHDNNESLFYPQKPAKASPPSPPASVPSSSAEAMASASASDDALLDADLADELDDLKLEDVDTTDLNLDDEELLND
jgi:hypothetical protein